ncbi:hypothetical protein Ahy_A03g016629 [Arachis hypogaea]|uniref:Transposase MuDR plant domain-containing protein n=1 Tax=Arachis hypogaea TaxID=3818 RepID=A0A445E3W0_ARAHY|nr:hypothetical protein Ahy_A03g016629 [Arachis hypogaea]
MSLEVGLRHLDSDNELREMCCHGGKNNGVVDVYIEYGEGSWRASQVKFQDGERPPVKPKPKIVPKPKPMPSHNNVTRTRRYCLRSLGKGFSKAKEDAGDLVVLSSDSDSHDSYENVDIGFVEGGIKAYNHDAFDPASKLDGANLWHSLEMKIPPNSEDELVGEESLEKEFKVAVREFTIKEGRRMRFRKNDGKRVRAVCKVTDCKWVVYALRDHEDNCWQMKTFFNDHTCPREDRNKATNRNWVAGISCVHACAALARVNKHPEDFYHKLITMESYKETYNQYNKPLAPPIKRKPGNLQTKRRKDSDEGTSSSKKSKLGTAMKRQLRPFTCKYCLQNGHTKRGCEKKRAADTAQATVDVAAAAKAAEATKDPKNVTAQATATTQAAATATIHATATSTSTATVTANITINSAPIGQALEIDLSQPICFEPKDSQKFTEVKGEPATRPAKLPARRRSPPTTPSTALDPMKGASSATASRFTNFLKFVPTPEFKHPRKK